MTASMKTMSPNRLPGDLGQEMTQPGVLRPEAECCRIGQRFYRVGNQKGRCERITRGHDGDDRLNLSSNQTGPGWRNSRTVRPQNDSGGATADESSRRIDKSVQPRGYLVDQHQHDSQEDAAHQRLGVYPPARSPALRVFANPILADPCDMALIVSRSASTSVSTHWIWPGTRQRPIVQPRVAHAELAQVRRAW